VTQDAVLGLATTSSAVSPARVAGEAGLGFPPAMRAALGILVGIGFLAVMVYISLAETAVRCEVCLQFNGASACRAGSGADAASAVQIAVSTACSELAHNRTENIRCQATRPSSRSCE
jgi:hypothetical protein